MDTEQYQATWSSLSNYRIPKWFRDCKFGIYTHWGPYSVASYGSNGSWYPHRMYDPETPEYDHHVRTYGSPDKFGYKDLIPLFTAEKFDADEWVDLFHGAGARFAGPVAEHHDGFSMWDSKLTDWNSMQRGPKRDVVGELEQSIRAKGLKFVTTFHHAYNWWFFSKGRDHGDCADPRYSKLYSQPHGDDDCPDEAFLGLWLNKLREVVDNYQPDLIWLDFGLGRIRERYRLEFLAYYYNRALEWKREVVATYKQMPPGNFQLHPLSAVMDLEVGKMNKLTPNVWLTDTSVDAGPGGCWSHVRNVGFKSVERLIHNLVDRVSKNGYLLLNVGPRADGSIPEGARECLRGIGSWLQINGEAIFGSVPWLVAGEGPTAESDGDHFNETNEARFTAHDIRFTSKDNAIYATCLGRPGDAVTLRTFREKRYLYPEDIASITMLGSDHELKWRFDSDGLTFDVPSKMPSHHACVFKISLHANQDLSTKSVALHRGELRA